MNIYLITPTPTAKTKNRISKTKMKSRQCQCSVIDRNTLEWILRILLIIASFYFVFEMIGEFLEENTYFSVIKKSIDKEDFPTITVCLIAKREMKYGEDYRIQILNSTIPPWDQDSANTSLITLRNGTNGYDFITGKREITQ